MRISDHDIIAFQSFFQIFDSFYAGTGYRLIGRVDDSLDPVFVVKRLHRNHRLNRRAVRICDDASVPVDIVRIDFRYDERNFGIHSPCAAVINDNATVCRGDRGKFFACGTARGEKRDVDRFVEGILRQFFEDVFLSFKFDGFSCRSVR